MSKIEQAIKEFSNKMDDILKVVRNVAVVNIITLLVWIYMICKVG